MKKENAIRYYRKFSGAERYIIGFFYKHDLYMIDAKEIMPRFIQVGKNSSSRGGGEKLRLRLNNKYKEQLIRKGAVCIGTDKDLNEISRNKGISFEKMIYRLNGQEPRPADSIRFDKCGDININGIEYQIKFDGAQIVNYSTLKKIQKERRKNA